MFQLNLSSNNTCVKRPKIPVFAGTQMNLTFYYFIDAAARVRNLNIINLSDLNIINQIENILLQTMHTVHKVDDTHDCYIILHNTSNNNY